MFENQPLRVFKFPDKNGNITYQVQTPEGEWHLTDEKGNFLPKEKEKEQEMETQDNPISVARKTWKCRRSQKKHFGMKTSLYLDETLFIRAKHYCADYRITLTELINRSLLLFLKKAEKKAAKEERQNDAEAE